MCFPGFPSMGAWVSYGLGSLSQNLPTFVVLPDSRGFAPNGPANWSAGFLPAANQGTMVRPGARNPIFDLFPPEDAGLTPEAQSEGLALLNRLNRAHEADRSGDSRLEARIASYELAARLQLSAPEVLDLSRESAATRSLYGLDNPVTEDFGRNCLIARRLLERGVRFVQVWSGADNGFPRRNWDSHEDIARDHGDMGTSMDQPAAALIKDLKTTGLLDETIVIWTTEFGRMPCSQGSKGRDHNPFAFTSWLAGGGIKGGVTYGATDEWSYKAVDKITYCYDLHATVLHLLGIDHTKLTFRHNGIDRRLTDVHGHVIKEILTLGSSPRLPRTSPRPVLRAPNRASASRSTHSLPLSMIADMRKSLALRLEPFSRFPQLLLPERQAPARVDSGHGGHSLGELARESRPLGPREPHHLVPDPQRGVERLA